MRVLFVSANTEQISLPTLPLGLGCVAAATERAGHEVKLVDLMDQTDTLPAIRAAVEGFRPDIIGISVRNIDDQAMENTRFLLDQAKGVVADCRAVSDARIVLGGAGFSLLPEAVLAYLGVEMGIQGEGEKAFTTLLDHLERGADLSGVPGLYLPGQGLQGERAFTKDLDEFPLPDDHLLGAADAGKEDMMISVQTRRGCPMDCSYCSTATIEGRRLRKRSPDAVVEWIARRRRAGFKKFMFVDNTFNMPAPYARELCRVLAKEGLDISWACIIYPGVGDRDLVKDMAEAGCYRGEPRLRERVRPDARQHEQAFRQEGCARVLEDAGRSRDKPDGLPASRGAGGNAGIGYGEFRTCRFPAPGPGQALDRRPYLSTHGAGKDRGR